MTTNLSNINSRRGFTLIEMMIVVIIIGVLAAFAYPSYQQYVINSKRTDMMSEMHNIATEIESRKLAQGKYSNALILGLGGDYPKVSPIYTVAIGPTVITSPPSGLTSKWIITATPKPGTPMAADGVLSLNYQGIKCRKIGTSNACKGDDWKR